jgi:sec-independent protein translocase protein TatA
MSLGLTEIALILVVVLVLFGGKRIPELAKALGKAQYIRPKRKVKNTSAAAKITAKSEKSTKTRCNKAVG